MALIRAKTNYGVVTGTPGRDPACTVFKGIPYAKPPVGELRFAPPQRPDCWEGERPCTEFAPICVQSRDFPLIEGCAQSEDSLYLNIWTPAHSADERLPVELWIYGGGFINGASNEPATDGEAFAREGVILVTFNYRLGLLGNLALPELLQRDGTTGNYGMLDQIAALNWVYENIAAFGGDPDRITVAGFSAGGMSTRMLAVSPKSKHMIRRIIVQSAGALNDSDYYRPLEDKMAMSQVGLDRLGWTLDDLMRRDAYEIFTKMQEATVSDLEWWEKSLFQPNVDPDLLPDTPGRALWNGLHNDIDILCGALSGDRGWVKLFQDQIPDPDMVPCLQYARVTAWARRQMALDRRPPYVYYMDRAQPEGPALVWGGPNNRCPHGAEISYVFGNLERNGAIPTEDYTDYDRELSRTMTKYWCNFIRTGNPNGGDLPHWPAYTDETRQIMFFDQERMHLFRPEDQPAALRLIRYAEDHPGLLRSLDGI